MKAVVVVLGVLALLGFLGVAGLVGYVSIWKPRQVLGDFDAFVARHPEGSSVEALAGDPFVLEASDLTFDEASLKDVKPGAPGRQAARLREVVRDAGTQGAVELMWTHTPPFGRVFLHVDYADGGITSLKTTDLD